MSSSYTFIYGAFAAVPLFLLWIYLSWNIVLMGGILVHSLSAYQNEEQANRPLVLKALDVLYLFWQRQETGQAVGEIELLNRKHEITRGLDSDTWGELRSVFLQKKLIAENDKGQYLLCRDLHSVSFWPAQGVGQQRVRPDRRGATGKAGLSRRPTGCCRDSASSSAIP